MMAMLAAMLGLILLFCAVVIVQLGFVLTLIVVTVTLGSLIAGITALSTWVTGRRAA